MGKSYVAEETKMRAARQSGEPGLNKAWDRREWGLFLEVVQFRHQS